MHSGFCSRTTTYIARYDIIPPYLSNPPVIVTLLGDGNNGVSLEVELIVVLCGVGVEGVAVQGRRDTLCALRKMEG